MSKSFDEMSKTETIQFLAMMARDVGVPELADEFEAIAARDTEERPDE